jgi:hypothetical protein
MAAVFALSALHTALPVFYSFCLTIGKADNYNYRQQQKK